MPATDEIRKIAMLLSVACGENDDVLDAVFLASVCKALETLIARVQEMEASHAQQIFQRVPIELIPESKKWPDALSTIAKLKTQRNSLLDEVEQLESFIANLSK